MERIPRAEVPEDQKWNSKALFSGWNEIDAEMTAVGADLPKLARFQGRLPEGADVVAEYFDLVQGLVMRVEQMSIYADIEKKVDTTNERAKSTSEQLEGLYARLRAAAAFAEPEMVSMVDTLLEWANSVPSLAAYKRYFEFLKQQGSHTRSSEVEELLGLLTEPFAGPNATWSDLFNVDLIREDIMDAQGQAKPYKQLLSVFNKDPDRSIRQQLYTKGSAAYQAYKNTLTSNYLTSVRQDIVLAKARRYQLGLADENGTGWTAGADFS